MNIEKLERDIQSLVTNLDENTFIYDLLLAYGQPKASITRLKKGDYNQAKMSGEILWKKKLFFRKETEADLHSLIDSVQNDPNIIKHHPRFMIVTDFDTILTVDTKTKDTLDVPFEELAKYYDFFLPWAGMEKSQFQLENPADRKAAERMGRLYDIIREENPINTEEDRHALNIFLSRLLFCFFAEDTSIFAQNQFTKAIASHTISDGSDLQAYLQRLFRVLNQQDRSNYPQFLQAFPYVNGSLYADDLPVPVFSARSRKIIVESGSLNWKAINPDIFGSMIQAVVHDSLRGNLGMHYTSVVNIMKVIKPLFLDDLYEELERAGNNKKKLEQLLNRLQHLRIFDPACGSGNFLIIVFKELCKLEIEILKRLHTRPSGEQLSLGLTKEVTQLSFQFVYSKIQLTQFYGIEIDDFAQETAKLSLWLAEHQMNLAFKEVFGITRPTLPLQDGGNIVCGNATRLDWEEVCPKEEDCEIYVLGNPPYLGSKVQDKEQKADMIHVFQGMRNFKFLDYISCWFYQAAEYIKSNVKCAFVTTNSINQGLQVEMLWPKIFAENIEIFFSYHPFKWSNSAKANAGVTCTIIGLRELANKPKYIFRGNHTREVNNINAYLVDSKNIIVSKSMKPLNNLPVMRNGNPPREGGLLILSTEEKDKLVSTNPGSSKFIRQLSGSNEFINSMNRWCIWIADSEIEEANSIPFIKDRIDKVRDFRLAGGIIARGCANIPHRFYMNNMPQKSQVIVPIVSSERRKYIPTGFLGSDVVVVNSANTIFDADPYVFGIVNSRIHMTWIRAVAGRLESRIRYSPALCYNTFPFPEITETQKKTIEDYVFNVLDERELHSEKTMGQLYDPDKMPAGLRQAHHELDLAVERCYRPKPFQNDEERLEYLFKLYEEMSKAEKEQGAN